VEEADAIELSPETSAPASARLPRQIDQVKDRQRSRMSAYKTDREEEERNPIVGHVFKVEVMQADEPKGETEH
jgi:hypothetical protein